MSNELIDKLKGASIASTYDSGEVELVNVHEKNEIVINNNHFIPRYSYGDVRRKDLPAIQLYKSGEIKGIDIEGVASVQISNYHLKAEKVTFYKNGRIKKVFPLNGRLSAYWSEDEEYKLAQNIRFTFGFGSVNNKIICVKFYESGAIKSLTFWPKERISIKYKDRIIRCRTGISMFENGKLMTCEPSTPVEVSTPIGNLEAFHKNSIGITGDSNSLKFDKEGNVIELITSTNTIKVINKKGQVVIHSPRSELIFAGAEEKQLIPLRVNFVDNVVIIDKKYKYELSKFNFDIGKYGEKTMFL